MNNKKYTCGLILPSACSIYTGSLPDFIDEDSLTCEPNVDDILKLYGDKIDEILEGLDLTGLDKGCLEFVPATIKVKELFQLHNDELCLIKDRLDELELPLDIGSKHITVDLKCMKPTSNPCGLGTDTYTLLAVINLLVNEICLLKSQIA